MLELLEDDDDEDESTLKLELNFIGKMLLLLFCRKVDDELIELVIWDILRGNKRVNKIELMMWNKEYENTKSRNEKYISEWNGVEKRNLLNLDSTH